MARPDDTRDVATMIGRAKALLGVDPRAAATLARALPPSIEGRFLLGAALRRCGDVREALEVLASLVAVRPDVWGIHYEHGMALAMLGRDGDAVGALERATTINPHSSLAWHALGDLYGLRDRGREVAAHSRPLPGSIGDAAFVAAVIAWIDAPASSADETLRTRFGIDLNDPAAVRLVADVAVRSRRDAAAEALFAKATEVAPDYLPIRFHRAVLLYRMERGAEALAALQPVLLAYDGSPTAHALRASIMMQLGRENEAVADFDAALAASPDDARLWHSYGHALRSVGRQGDAVAAYRSAIRLDPAFGEAYWSLANLKTWRFEADDIVRMLAVTADADLRADDSAHVHFALGKALEDAADYPQAFAHYEQANAARRATDSYDGDGHAAFVQRTIAMFDAAFFAERVGAGARAADPIFVLGMPRSGSTLVEQILASHSRVEGLSELPDITALARRVAGDAGDYPYGLATLPHEAFTALGEEYLERTRPRRTTDRPFFVDKFPGNFLQIGLIQLMLPNARIIDVRRRPLGCCVSLFKQNFASGQGYSYDLGDLGRYFVEYDRLMRHFDAALPSRVLHVSYEAIVDAPEREIRRLLDHVGLAFEPGCLSFFQSDRAVRTPSSEQVRRPIFRDGLDRWRHFDPWLGPLKAALGPLVSDVPYRP